MKIDDFSIFVFNRSGKKTFVKHVGNPENISISGIFTEYPRIRLYTIFFTNKF